MIIIEKNKEEEILYKCTINKSNKQCYKKWIQER